MKILGKYVVRYLLESWLLSGAILGVLLFLVRLIDELERITQSYRPLEVVFYVALTLPQQLISLVPVILLVGSLTAFARLSQSNELTIVRGSGITRHKFLGLMAPLLLVVAGLLWGAMEWVTAPMYQLGEEIRNEARGQNSLAAGEDLWSRSGNTFIRLGRLYKGNQPGDIDIFRFAEDNQLEEAIHAGRAEVVKGRRWRLLDVQVIDNTHSPMGRDSRKTLEVDGLWSEGELSQLLLSLNSMSPSVIYQHVQYLERNGLRSLQYRLAFWDRMLMPLTAMAMVVMALGLSSGPASQRAGLGRQLGVGMLAGVVFYLGSQITLALGQVLELPPLAVALFPLGSILVLAWFFYSRLNW